MAAISVATICRGPQLLITAGLAEGRTPTAWPPLQGDLGKAGANVVDQEVVVDRNLVSPGKPDDIPAFVPLRPLEVRQRSVARRSERRRRTEKKEPRPLGLGLFRCGGREFGSEAQRLGSAALIWPNADPRSRSTARSPIETMPRARPFSTTGSLRTACRRISSSTWSTES
jgi:hypothetical protein